MMICRAMLKYGHSNFSLTILEYCEPGKCLEREGYYINLFNSEYNYSKNPAASFYGLKHSDESRKKISDAKIGLQAGENNPFFGKNHSAESRKKISEAKLAHTRPEGSGRPCQRIEVFDNKNNQTNIYDSIGEAGRALNISKSIIASYLKRDQQKPYKGQYIFKRV
jgi:group I intron endonuclease